MFTGIIESVGKIASIDLLDDLSIVGIKSNFQLSKLNIGDSIAINGVCLTITKIIDGIVFFDIVSETLSKTNLVSIKIDDYVNMERAMKVNNRLNGHLVQGHIDGLSRIISIKKNEKETKLKLELNNQLMKHCIYKGSICIDGISLTIADLKDDYIELAIIPHTLNNTTLKYKKNNDLLNIETDMISKYVTSTIQNMDFKQ